MNGFVCLEFWDTPHISFDLFCLASYMWFKGPIFISLNFLYENSEMGARVSMDIGNYIVSKLVYNLFRGRKQPGWFNPFTKYQQDIPVGACFFSFSRLTAWWSTTLGIPFHLKKWIRTFRHFAIISQSEIENLPSYRRYDIVLGLILILLEFDGKL